MGNVVPENQESRCNWQRIGPIVSRQCLLAAKSKHIQMIDEFVHLFIHNEVINESK